MLGFRPGPSNVKEVYVGRQKSRAPKNGTLGWLIAEAIETIKDSESWTKEAFARDATEAAVDIFDPRACKFCVRGAIMRVAWNLSQNKEFTEYVDGFFSRRSFQIIPYTPGMKNQESTDEMNDAATHEQVLAHLKHVDACYGQWTLEPRINY